MRKLFIISALFATFILGALPVFAQSSSNDDFYFYCTINGTKFTLGDALRKFGGIEKAYKGCCDCGGKNALCLPGYYERVEKDGYYYNLTLIAAKYNHLGAMKYLYNVCGVKNIDLFPFYAHEKSGYNHLMWAVKNGNLEMVNFILEHRDKVNITARSPKDNKTAFDFAKESGNKDIINAISYALRTSSIDSKEKEEIQKLLNDIRYGLKMNNVTNLMLGTEYFEHLLNNK